MRGGDLVEERLEAQALKRSRRDSAAESGWSLSNNHRRLAAYSTRYDSTPYMSYMIPSRLSLVFSKSAKTVRM